MVTDGTDEVGSAQKGNISAGEVTGLEASPLPVEAKSKSPKSNPWTKFKKLLAQRNVFHVSEEITPELFEELLKALNQLFYTAEKTFPGLRNESLQLDKILALSEFLEKNESSPDKVLPTTVVSLETVPASPEQHISSPVTVCIPTSDRDSQASGVVPIRDAEKTERQIAALRKHAEGSSGSSSTEKAVAKVKPMIDGIGEKITLIYAKLSRLEGKIDVTNSGTAKENTAFQDGVKAKFAETADNQKEVNEKIFQELHASQHKSDVMATQLQEILKTIDGRISLNDAQQILKIRSDVERHVKADLVLTVSKAIAPALDHLAHMEPAKSNHEISAAVRDLERRCAEAGLVTDMHKLF